MELNRTSKPDCLIEINIDMLETEKPILFSSIFRGFKLLPLETKEECLIGQINQLEMLDDTLYVLDSNIAKSLLLFDNKGRYIKKIGKIGKGPGEYSQPSSFSIDFKKKQIQILDIQSQKVIIFSTQGKLIHEMRLNGSSIPIQITTQDDLIYIDQIVSKQRKPSFLLYAIENSGKIVSRWLPYQIYTKGFEQSFTTTTSFFKTRNDIKYIIPLCDTIFSIRSNKVKPFMVVSTKNRITTADVNAMNRIEDPEQFINYYYGACTKFMGVTDYVESNHLISFMFRDNRMTYISFYFPEKKEMYCTSNLIDDLTKQEVTPSFYSASENNFVSCIQNTSPDAVKKFIENVNNRIINIAETERIMLKRLTPSSNPVIVLYECKDKIHWSNDLSEK